VFELPTTYNAFKYQLVGADWSRVHVLHDGWTMRSSRWWAQSQPAVTNVLRMLYANATRLMARVAMGITPTTNRSRVACYYEVCALDPAAGDPTELRARPRAGPFPFDVRARPGLEDPEAMVKAALGAG